MRIIKNSKHPKSHIAALCIAAATTLMMSQAHSTMAVPITSPQVLENTIFLPEVSGWYQVQNTSNYSTVCEGDISTCTVDNGTYLVVNHTTQMRWDPVVVNGTTTPTTGSGITLTVNTISWPSDGWYQVQDANNYQTICQGGNSCTVENGTYAVINHTLNSRIEITVDSAGPTPGPEATRDFVLAGNTISFSDIGWFQVQDSFTYQTVCQGEPSCVLTTGNYIVINHTTGERFTDVAVRDALTRTQCTAAGGRAIGDIGDGAIHEKDYRCESGQPPIAGITYEAGEPVDNEGAVCCV